MDSHPVKINIYDKRKKARLTGEKRFIVPLVESEGRVPEN